MDAMLRGQFSQRQLALDRLQRNLRLEIRPVTLPAYFPHDVPSLNKAGIA